MELTKEQIKNMQEGLSNPVPWDSYVYATAVSNLLGTIAARDAEIAALKRRPTVSGVKPVCLDCNKAGIINCSHFDNCDGRWVYAPNAALRGRMEALDKAICDLPRQKRSPDDPYGLVEVDKVLLLVRAALDAPSPTQSEVSTLRGQMEALRKAAQDLLNERAATDMNEYEAYQFVFKSQGREFWSVLEGALVALDAPSETGKPASKSRYENECEESGGGCS